MLPAVLFMFQCFMVLHGMGDPMLKMSLLTNKWVVFIAHIHSDSQSTHKSIASMQSLPSNIGLEDILTKHDSLFTVVVSTISAFLLEPLELQSS